MRKIIRSPLVALALDVSPKEAEENIRQFAPFVDVFKIPPFLFYSGGKEWIHRIKERGKRVFVDVKLHDIPRTVQKTVEQLVKEEVDFLTVHIAGGSEMIKSAVEAAQDSLLLLGVTLLTSLNTTDVQMMFCKERNSSEYIQKMALIGLQAGLKGLVCSPHDIPGLRKFLPEPPFFACPGIRLDSDKVKTDDQKRIATISEALSLGADMLILGRGVYTHPDPEKILKQLKSRLQRI